MCVYFLIRRAHAKHNKKKSSRNQTNKMVLFIIRLPCLRNRRSKKKTKYALNQKSYPKKHLHLNLFIFSLLNLENAIGFKRQHIKCTFYCFIWQLVIWVISFGCCWPGESQEMLARKKMQYVQWSNQLNKFFCLL